MAKKTLQKKTLPASAPAPITKTTDKTPKPIAAMNEVEKATAIKALIVRLEAKPPTNEQKSIRRSLRALGHKGGLRSVHATAA